MENNCGGFWAKIPATVLLNEELKANEKLLYGLVSMLTVRNGYCFATNGYLAEQLNAKPNSISIWLSHLKEMGFLIIHYIKDDNGAIAQRQIYTNDIPNLEDKGVMLEMNLDLNEGVFDKYQRGGLINIKGGISQISKYNKNNIEIDNIKENKENIKEKFKTEFESLWALYPNKKGKESAYKSYCKARKDGVEEITVRQGIENYVADIKRKGTEKQYILYGSTYFNGHRWEDEFTNTMPLKTKSTQSYDSSLYKQRANKPIEYKRKED